MEDPPRLSLSLAVTLSAQLCREWSLRLDITFSILSDRWAWI